MCSGSPVAVLTDQSIHYLLSIGHYSNSLRLTTIKLFEPFSFLWVQVTNHYRTFYVIFRSGIVTEGQIYKILYIRSRYLAQHHQQTLSQPDRHREKSKRTMFNRKVFYRLFLLAPKSFATKYYADSNVAHPNFLQICSPFTMSHSTPSLPEKKVYSRDSKLES